MWLDVVEKKNKIEKFDYFSISLWASQKFENQNLSQNKQRNKNKPKPIFLPEENYLNFKESGKIPDFLNTK